MSTLDLVSELCEKHNITFAELERRLDLSRGSLAKMKTSTPKADRLQKIAEYFDVSVEYLMTGKDSVKTSTSGKEYYFNDETAEMAQELYENKDMRLLFSTIKGSTPEMLQKTADIIRILKETNNDG